MKGLRARRHERLLELDEVERRLKPFGRRWLGVREIPLDALVGTDGRASSFTRDFRPLHAFSRDRLRSLEAAFADGGFPPIVAVKLGETYFVIDGHHRAALARRGGAEMIDADVTEFMARVPLPAGADMLEVVLRELERIFLGQRACRGAPRGARLGEPARALPRAAGEHPGPRLPLDAGTWTRARERRDRGGLVRRDLHADARRDRAPAPRLPVPRRAARRPVPGSPPASAGRVPV